MKNKILIFLTVLFVSCSAPSPWMPAEDFQSIEEIQEHMELYSYVWEEGIDLKTPEDVYCTKEGDCDLFCGLLAHFMIYSLGYDGVELVACLNQDGIPHVLVYYDGVYYEGENAKPTRTENEILFHYSYDFYNGISWIL